MSLPSFLLRDWTIAEGPGYGETLGSLGTKLKFPHIVHLMGEYLMGVCLMGVCLIGVHLMAMRLMGVCPMGVHLIGLYYGCASHRRMSYAYVS